MAIQGRGNLLRVCRMIIMKKPSVVRRDRTALLASQSDRSSPHPQEKPGTARKYIPIAIDIPIEQQHETLDTLSRHASEHNLRTSPRTPRGSQPHAPKVTPTRRLSDAEPMAAPVRQLSDTEPATPHRPSDQHHRQSPPGHPPVAPHRGTPNRTPSDLHRAAAQHASPPPNRTHSDLQRRQLEVSQAATGVRWGSHYV